MKWTLRAGTSGAVVSGPAGYVLTADADGSVSWAPGVQLETLEVTATDAVTALDLTGVNDCVVTLNVSTTLAIVWPAFSRVVLLELIQGPGGGKVPTFGAEVRFANNNATPVWATVAGHYDQLALRWDARRGRATASYADNYLP